MGSSVDTLLLSEMRYRTLVEATSAITWSCPASGLHVEAQPAWMAFTGQSAEEMLGAGWAKAVHPDDIASAEQRWTDAVARGVSYFSEHRIRRHDGEWRWMDVHAVPIRDASGGIVEWFGMNFDVTERKAMEAALAREGDRFRSALEAAPIAILMIDANGHIVHANAMLERTLGYAHDDLLGRTVETLIPAALRVQHVCLREGYMAAPHTRCMGEGRSLIARRADGTEIPVDVGLSTIRLDNEPMVLAAIADISEHNAAIAREAQARAAAEAASLAKSNFLANMSHEVRTPLNAVLGLNELIRLGGVTDKQAGFLDKQRAAGQHLLRILNDVLDMARIEAGKAELVERDFILADLVQGVKDLVQESAHAKGLELSVQVGSDRPSLVGDITRLQQALLNLANNAVKFTEAGNIRISVYPALESDTEVLLRFEVEDTGIGIDADKLPQLFRPFEQVDASSTRRFGGTGLGLAITKKIAEMMHGTVGVSSHPGQGSRFWFTSMVKKASIQHATLAGSPLHATEQRPLALPQRNGSTSS